MSGNATEAKKHHYIPRFILRNYFNDSNQLFYWDVENKYLSVRNPKSIFMNPNMYRDELNSPEDPTIIEKKLASFETEISTLIQQKILSKEEIVLTRSELERLRIFMQLLSFRSDLRMNQYKQKAFTISTEALLSNFQPDSNYEDLWKKELFVLADIRSYAELKNNQNIDPVVKQEFFNLLEGYYMTIVDARGGEFILSDVLPTLEVFPVSPTINIHLHEFYPISPTRMIVLNHIIFEKKYVPKREIIKEMIKCSRIKGDLLRQPQPHHIVGFGYYVPEDTFTYHPVKIYSQDLEYVNALILNEARNGVMFRDPHKILPSVSYFNKRGDTKTNHCAFEDKLSKM